MRPYGDVPVPHFCWLKSSMKEEGRAAFAFALMFEALAFALAVTLLLRLSLRVLAFTLVFVFEPRLANAMIITTTPMPMMSTAASPPSIHQIALDFLGVGAPGGVGCHCGGGGGGGGGGVVVGRGVMTCCCGR